MAHGRAGRRRGPGRDRWRALVQHRFRGTGALAGHAVGNLLLAGLIEVLGDPVAALDEVGALLGCAGGCSRCAATRWTSRPRSPAWARSRTGPTGSAARSRSPPRRAGCAGSGCGRTRREPAREALAAVARRRRARSSDPAPGSPGAAAPAGARAAGRDHRQPGAPGGGAEPGPAAGGDRRVLARTAPGRTLAARPGPSGRLGARRRRRGAGPAAAAPGGRGRLSPGGRVLLAPVPRPTTCCRATIRRRSADALGAVLPAGSTERRVRVIDRAWPSGGVTVAARPSPPGRSERWR